MHVNDKIKIDKNVAIPPVKKDWQTKYPFREMRVGDSFLFPKTVSVGAARSSAQQTGRRLDMKFTVRQTEQGIRCWRIA